MTTLHSSPSVQNADKPINGETMPCIGAIVALHQGHRIIGVHQGQLAYHDVVARDKSAQSAWEFAWMSHAAGTRVHRILADGWRGHRMVGPVQRAVDFVTSFTYDTTMSE